MGNNFYLRTIFLNPCVSKFWTHSSKLKQYVKAWSMVFSFCYFINFIFFFCKSHGCLHVLWKEAVLKIFAEEESTHSRHLFSNTSYCRCLTWKPKFIIGINTISIGEGYVWAIVIQHEERNLTEYWHISESWHKSEFQVRLN